MYRRLLTHTFVFCFLLLSLPIAAQPQTTLTVFAAASLTDAFEAIGEVFEAENPGVNVIFSFAGSSDLAAQISEGAPADVFASANVRQMENAVASGRIDGEPQIFAYNRLVLITPADNPARIFSVRGLASPGVQWVIASPGVPIRDYTETLFERLAADARFGEDFRTAAFANIVSEEQNVRQVVAKVALGEADAGIVYFSDVTPDLNSQLRAFPIADRLNTRASYPIAALSDSPNREAAQAFVAFVISEAGQSVLERWNFIPVQP